MNLRKESQCCYLKEKLEETPHCSSCSSELRVDSDQGNLYRFIMPSYIWEPKPSDFGSELEIKHVHTLNSNRNITVNNTGVFAYPTVRVGFMSQTRGSDPLALALAYDQSLALLNKAWAAAQLGPGGDGCPDLAKCQG
ncbi:hypothetical protein J6590_009647 [Homalodisca vitripennis]|nr:hypothetical protein J6590_009647 [Homalodisca vitripennis]